MGHRGSGSTSSLLTRPRTCRLRARTRPQEIRHSLQYIRQGRRRIPTPPLGLHSWLGSAVSFRPDSRRTERPNQLMPGRPVRRLRSHWGRSHCHLQWSDTRRSLCLPDSQGARNQHPQVARVAGGPTQCAVQQELLAL